MPPNDQQLGPRIRARREELGLNLRALAARADIDPGYLSRIEHGSVSPGTSALVALASALELPVGQVVGETARETGLPALPFYLRAKYDLDDVAIADVAQYLQQRYGTEPGPRDGEDEVDDTSDTRTDIK